MKKYVSCLKATLIVLLGSVMLFASCKDDEEQPKSSVCDVVSFTTVDNVTWTVSGLDITHTYPPETEEGQLTPIIEVSKGATISPVSGVAQNFFSATGVTYTVTAQDGVTKKTYTARATRTLYSDSEIESFTVNAADWVINGSDITYVYSADTNPATPFTPIITLSQGATVSPASGVAQNFFSAAGVTYTVTAQNGTKKTYTARATRTPYSDSDIVSFHAKGASWNIDGTNITYTFLEEITEENLTPTISLSPGATINPLASVAQNFFTETGVMYVVTAEDGVTKKTYTVIAHGLKKYTSTVMENWVVLSRNGYHDWGIGKGTDLWSGGHPMLVIDNNLNSGWHSKLYTPMPQVLIIDMKESKRVSKISGTGNYLYTMEIYLTDDLSIDGYSSHTVNWDSNMRQNDYDGWHTSLIGKVPETVPTSWGSPKAEGITSPSTFSFTLPESVEGQFLILRFPDNSDGGSTYIDIYDIEVFTSFNH
jgi:hypothetical protein